MATSGISVKKNSGGDGEEGKAKGSESNSTASKVKADSFQRRAELYGLSKEQCEEIQRENISPRGSASALLYPICAAGGGGEDLAIAIGCDDLSGSITIDPQMEKSTIDSQCEGARRTKIDGYTVNITIPLYLDRLLSNQKLLNAMYQSEPVASASANSGGTTYDAYGIGQEIYEGTLPRFYLEIHPSETDTNSSLSGILFFPYVEMDPIAGTLNFGRTENRTVQLTMMATLPPAVADSAVKPVVSGIWRARGAAA